MINLPIDQAIPTGRFFSDRFYAAFLACAVHAVLFTAGTLGLMRGVEYGIDASNGMAEVDLVAAPAPAAVPSVSATVPESAPHPVSADPEDVAERVKAATPPAPPAAAPVPNALLTTKDLSGPLGDGSSPVPGADATTVHRAGSSGSYFKPGYYRNPPPRYPEEARKLKQQGRVLLDIVVNVEGKPETVALKQSSGYPLLDQAALDGVRAWRFRPANVGGVRVSTRVEVPIRFQLK